MKKHHERNTADTAENEWIMTFQSRLNKHGKNGAESPPPFLRQTPDFS
jgi:hypothetical protein